MSDNRAVATSGPAGPPLPGVPASRPGGGLRERKKRRTREAIQREAMRLFLEQGYEATTVEQIAEAADVSPSTFFNYFPAKEDVVFRDDIDEVFAQVLMARPKGEPLGAAVRGALTEGMAAVFHRERDLALARGKLALQVPELRARAWEEMERTQRLMQGVIAERTGRDPDDFELRVATAVVLGAVYEASLEWVRQEGRGDLVEMVVQALDLVERGIHL